MTDRGVVAIEAMPVRAPDLRPDDLDGTADTLLVVVTDEAGRQGVGETDASPEVASAFLTMPTAHLWSRNATEILAGRDPVDLAANWQALYEGTFWPGRRGLGVHALGAVDVALHDLAGKQLGLPVWKLLGGARRHRLRPYATLWPGLPAGRSLHEIMAEIGRQAEAALDEGFRAVKVELVVGDLVDDRALVRLINEARRIVGDDILMAVDFGYRWANWHDAAVTLSRAAEADILFAEACLSHDDLDGHARLADRAPMRVGGAEAAATRWEVREWLTRGQVGVVQPNVARAGGLSEARRIVDLCEIHGAEFIPHGWKTGITAAVGRHLQAASCVTPVFEVVLPRAFPSLLRRHLLTTPEPAVRDGWMDLPDGPGLGIEVDWEFVARLRRGEAS